MERVDGMDTTPGGTAAYLGLSMDDDVPAWLAHPVVRIALALDPALLDDPNPLPFLDAVRQRLEDRASAG